MTVNALKSIVNTYKTVPVRNCRYRYVRVPLNNQTSVQVTYLPSTSQNLEWRVSGLTPLNMCRSFIQNSLSIPALANNYAVYQQSGFPYRVITFGTAGNQNLVELQNCDSYVHATRPFMTPLKEYLCQDALSGMYPCNQLNTQNLLPFSRDGLTNSTENASSVSYLEQQYLRISPAVNTALSVTEFTPLNAIRPSYFAQDMDSIFAVDMFLRAQTNYGQRMSYYTTTPNTPSLNVTAQAGNITASNVYLYVAVEQNVEICNSLLQSLAKGEIEYDIEYPFTYRASVPGGATSTQLNYTVNIQKAFGSVLKRVTFALANGSEFTNLAYDHSNVNGTKLANFFTSYDNRNLQDSQINCYNPASTIDPNNFWTNTPSDIGSDWREQRELFKDSAVLNYNVYQNNWSYSDSWSLPPTAPKNAFDGLPERLQADGTFLLNGDHTYIISGNCSGIAQAASNCFASGLVLYVWCIFYRHVKVNSAGLILES